MAGLLILGSMILGQQPWGFFNAAVMGQPTPMAAKSVDPPPPEEFQFNQSTIQAFYFIQYIYNDAGDLIQPEEGADWFAAFNPNTGVCTGARLWMGEYSEIPVMGDDGESYSAGYMTSGLVPTFQYYDSSADAFYELDHNGTAGEFHGNSFYTVDFLVGDQIGGDPDQPDPGELDPDFDLMIQVRDGIPNWFLVE